MELSRRQFLAFVGVTGGATNLHNGFTTVYGGATLQLSVYQQVRTLPRGSNWPNNGPAEPPRPSVIGIRRRR